jgi:hypothetical protein
MNPIHTNEYAPISHFLTTLFKGVKDKNVGDDADVQNETITENLSKMINKSAVDISMKNKQTFSTSLTSSNTLKLQACGAGKVVISGITQRNETDLNEDVESINDSSINLSKDISADLSDNILNKKSTSGTNVGEVVSNVFGRNQSQKNKVTTKITEIVENEIKQKINSENIQEAVTSIKSGNEISYDAIKEATCGADIEISEILQENITKAVIKKIFTNTTSIEMAETILNKMETYLLNEDNNLGDVSALGSAIAENIDATGDAIGTVTDSIGGTVADVSENVTTGISNTMKYLFISGAVIITCCVCAVILWLIMSGSKPQNVAAAGSSMYRR